jgi:hypothetical protein
MKYASQSHGKRTFLYTSAILLVLHIERQGINFSRIQMNITKWSHGRKAVLHASYIKYLAINIMDKLDRNMEKDTKNGLIKENQFSKITEHTS